MEKKVSVVIPAYNKADFTVKTVESVLNQTYKNIEIIVIDDGSTDNTGERLRPYGDKIKYVYKENGGACSARNTGIRLSTGDYIAPLDCDDMYLPEKIEKSVEYLEKQPDFDFVHTPVYFIDEKDNILRVYSLRENRHIGWLAKRLIARNLICNSTALIRKSCFEDAGLFDETLFTHADWDMWLRLAEKCKVGYISAPLTLYRKSSGYILRHLEQAKREGLAVLEKAFKRNPRLSSFAKSRLISHVYFRNAVGYLKIEDLKKAKKELITAIQKNIFNLKALLLLIVMMVSGRSLVLMLRWLKLI